MNYKLETETLMNENLNDYGVLYKITCKPEEYSNVVQDVIVNIIGEDQYYNPSRDVWEQIQFKLIIPTPSLEIDGNNAS